MFFFRKRLKRVFRDEFTGLNEGAGYEKFAIQVKYFIILDWNEDLSR